MRVLFGLLLADDVELALALAHLCLVVQLQVFRLTLLLVEQGLGRLELPSAELFLLLVSLLLHLQALLKLTLGESERVILLLLGEDFRAEIVDLAAQANDLLILHRQVLLILLDRCLVLLSCGCHLMLMQ